MKMTEQILGPGSETDQFIRKVIRMNRKKNEVQALIDEIKRIEDELKKIAHEINAEKPWKRTLREDVGVVF